MTKPALFISPPVRTYLWLVLLLQFFGKPAFCGYQNDSSKNYPASRYTNKQQKVFFLNEQLKAFYPLDSGEYSIMLCADIPVNDNPKRVYKKGETGHVFMILSKKDNTTGEVISRSFGFYPRVPVTFMVKQVRSKMLDNSNREYDVSINKKLSAAEFLLLLEKCQELSKRKYNLKKYNCYDYVLDVFNSLPGIVKLPVTHVKFPFIFGKGGSPCGLYKDLRILSTTGSSWASFIQFGSYKSPSNFSKKLLASY